MFGQMKHYPHIYGEDTLIGILISLESWLIVFSLFLRLNGTTAKEVLRVS